MSHMHSTSSGPDRQPTMRELAAWLTYSTRLVDAANRGWPRGTPRVEWDAFHAGVYRRAFPGRPYAGAKEARKALAVAFADDSGRIARAAHQYFGEFAAALRAEGGVR